MPVFDDGQKIDAAAKAVCLSSESPAYSPKRLSIQKISYSKKEVKQLKVKYPEVLTEFPKDIIGYVFTWHANPGACRKCQALNGREYRGQDLFAAQLVDPEYGPVWDLNRDVSLAHPHCKCTLFVRVEKFNLERLEGYQETMSLMERML